MVRTAGGATLATGGDLFLGAAGDAGDADGYRTVYAWAPPTGPGLLGDPSFRRDHRLELPLMCGAMANGISSTAMVVALSRAGILGSYGAAGQSVEEIGAALDTLTAAAGPASFSVNLIHSPQEPAHEERVVDLLLARKVRLVEASAFMAMTPAVVRYRVTGLRRRDEGEVEAPNHIIAKASRLEVADRWLSPPPVKIVAGLLEKGLISPLEAELSKRVPMAQDITAEADSGGHTDNRPAITLLPAMIALRDALQARHGYPCRLRVGLGGGISTPASAAAAFAMGAAYLVTGSVNQACVEAGTSERVKRMLAETGQADVTMAPAADMFEMGVRLQVLKRGTMFPMRAAKLYEIYRTCGSLEEIPSGERENLEKNIFRSPLEEIWRQTRAWFMERDPRQAERGDTDPRHRMALVFRWYLGHSSLWAARGDEGRTMDYQIWAGPALGAFNEWAAGTFLQDPGRRRVVNVNRNIILGAVLQGRINALRSQGVELSEPLRRIAPLEDAELQEHFN